MRSIYLTLILSIAASCSEVDHIETATATDELVHCGDKWEISYVYLKNHHQSGGCLPFSSFDVTVLDPCANFPLTPTLEEYPAWDCENVDDEYVYCEGYYDEDLLVAEMYLTLETAELIAGDCYWVFAPG